MPTHTVSVSALIPAPAARIYNLIADYRNGHPRILPKPPFVELNVEEGGVGAGTVINFQMRLMGQLRYYRAVVSEPEPGRRLVETNIVGGGISTFVVDPVGEAQARVTISTEVEVRAGFAGKIEGWFTTQMLQPTYVRELAQLAAVASEHKA
jgi:hypothetical protein